MRFAGGIRVSAVRKMAGRKGGESRSWRRSRRREEKVRRRKKNLGLGLEEEPEGGEI